MEQQLRASGGPIPASLDLGIDYLACSGLAQQENFYVHLACF